MKRRIFPLLLIMLAFSLSSCIETPQQREMRERTEVLQKDSSKLGTEIETIREEAGKLRADTSADADSIRQALAELKGGVEEKGYETAKLKENMELLSSTVQTLDGRIKEFEQAKEAWSEGKQEETERTVSALKDTAGELKNSLKSIDERLKKLEEKEGAAKNDVAAPDATTLYLEGLDLVRVNRDYEKGIQAFERFLSLYPDHELSDNAQYWIGEAYYATGDWEKAVLEFNKVIKNYPKGDKVPAALLKQAFSFERLGAMKESRILLKKVIAEHPRSTEAEIAEKHLKEPDKEGTKDTKK